MRKHKQNQIIETVKKHIAENLNLYILVSLFFLTGIIAGVLFLNNINDNAQEPVDNYIINFIQEIKSGKQIDHNELLKQTILNHVIFTIIIWFMGCTVIGLPIVYGLISWKGFSLSYTIGSIILSLGTSKGIVFCILSLLLHNVIAIPIYIALGVSGNRLYKSIIKNKKRENIKMEILRHTLFSLLMLACLIASTVVECYVSSTLTELYAATIEV